MSKGIDKMTTATDTYFESIAELAAAAIAVEQPKNPTPPPVTDGSQAAASTSWSSRSVHPLQVLETDYINVVQKAVAKAGTDTNAAREAEFNAMSQYFALSSSEPILLRPNSEPLIDTRCAALQAQSQSLHELLKADEIGIYELLVSLVETALDIITAMTSDHTVQYADTGVRAAAKYIGLYPDDKRQALANWKQKNPDVKAQWPALLNDLERHLVQPLIGGAIAVASPRSLYNIESFYLFRLMHRFLGGSAIRPMDLDQKAIASGAATKIMHTGGADWLAAWHEMQIEDLADRLKRLGTRLEQSLGLKSFPLRFHLKGGRAMNICLGTPREGTNDWDTGILIDPNLPPHQWYEVFSEVNDLVLHFLDQSRFAYTQLLNENKNRLVTLSKEPITGVDPHDDIAEYSQAGFLAEHLEEMTVGVDGTGAPRPFKPAGVNGELIDIGISTRNSVELAEHWAHLKIIEKQGTTGKMIPVPFLPYFVDDFTTIIREAIATKTVGPKLKKRFLRLDRVLESNDSALVQRVQQHTAFVQRALPKTYQALGINDKTIEGRLAVWLLAQLVQSVPGHAERPDWFAALDTYAAGNTAQLFSDSAIKAFWSELSKAFDKNEGVEEAAVKRLLIVETGVSLLAGLIMEDTQKLAAEIGFEAQKSTLWPSVKIYLDAIFNLPLQHLNGASFSLSGGIAALMQAAHESVALSDLQKTNTSGIVEVVLTGAPESQIDHLFGLLATHLSALKVTGCTVAYDQQTQRITVFSDHKITGAPLAVTQRAILQVRVATSAEETGSPDLIMGMPVQRTRNLVKHYIARASDTPDADLRTAEKTFANLLLKNVLGRQIA